MSSFDEYFKDGVLRVGVIGVNVSPCNCTNTGITLDFTKPGASVSPMLYGLMTEEINHSYDGGLYAELIRNRIFKDNKNTPEGMEPCKG